MMCDVSLVSLVVSSLLAFSLSPLTSVMACDGCGFKTKMAEGSERAELEGRETKFDDDRQRGRAKNR